ncbi:MAG: GNAT family N-acetyltransferase [Bacteroidales bacterium]|nr:GNAT family N-acetyltransferase [Bacteroidales bacterium]
MLKEKIKIMEALPDEWKVITDFQQKMALETENISLDAETVKKGVQQVFTDHSKGRYYLAKHDGEVVASMLTTFEWSDWRNGTVLWLQSVYVLPDYRKKGIFRMMYHHIKQKVENTESLVGIRLYVDKTNKVAQKVYESLGMSGDHYQLFEWMP